jgi:hypothetical protein
MQQTHAERGHVVADHDGRQGRVAVGASADAVEAPIVRVSRLAARVRTPPMHDSFRGQTDQPDRMLTVLTARPDQQRAP